MKVEDDEEIDYNSGDEGLQMLLGGITLHDVTIDAWLHEDQDQDQDQESLALDVTASVLLSQLSSKNVNKAQYMDERQRPIIHIHPTKLRDEQSSSACVRAHTMSTGLTASNGSNASTGQIAILAPSVQIVDLTFLNNRGKALVATKRISRGTHIFTEQAAFVTQTSTPSYNQHSQQEEQQLSHVRACQHCFRSMEPVSSCRTNPTNNNPESILPMPSLWPVAEDHWNQENDGTFRRDDKHDRWQCLHCKSMFCSTRCKQSHIQQMTSCCQCKKAMEVVLQMLPSSSEAIVMASRIFCTLLTQYRSSGNIETADNEDFNALCGNASDIQSLELGLPTRDEHGQIQYSLSPIYDAICSNDVLSVTTLEQSILSLDLFSRLAAIAARNGFSVRTQSPFRPYYSALLRAVQGRGTEQHQQCMSQIARIIGDSELLARTMDRHIDDLVAPQLIAIFTLIARINHSCTPNAMVQSQEFVDCRVDLVARQDICPGEEITISYINNEGRTTNSSHDRNRRRRELEAKYLFTCDCPLCGKMIINIDQ